MIAWTHAQFLVLSVGCLLLALAAYRGERLGFRRSMITALAWGAIFFLVAAVFSVVGPEQSPWRP